MKIRTFEAARGMLALWVVVGHTIKHAGYDAKDLGPLKLLASPGLAVDGFIMLSGFVIFLLLDSQNISYSKFIGRRFFRIAPLYAVLSIISALTQKWQIEAITGLPWQGTAGANDLVIHRDTLQFFPQHLLAHATMLHGAISDHFLPSSQYALLGQAWSISVEWQFYLIAPVIFFLVSSKKWTAVAGVLGLICIARSLNYGGEGFAINQAGFFVIGIACYYLWKHSDRVRPEDFRLIDVFALLAMTIVYLITQNSVSLMLWVAIFATAMVEKYQTQNMLLSTMAKVAARPVLQWLGKISYSIYLVHMLIIYFWSISLPWLFSGIGKLHFVMVQLVAVISSTIALSALTYRLIELPAIRLGNRLIAVKTVPLTVVGSQQG